MAGSAALAMVAASIVAADGHWAAVRGEKSCEARSRSLLTAPKGSPQPYAVVAFDRAGPRWGEMAIRLGRPAGEATVLLMIDTEPFQLPAKGEWAWSASPAQAQAMIAAMRVSGGMRVRYRAADRRRYSDRYLLSGAPTAIDAAAACAGR